jgi:PAS domain S-box-containing protein
METLRKIEELIVQNKTLEQRNEELKNIIEVNLRQSKANQDFISNYNIDLSDANTLILKFFQFHKVPVALFDDKGKLIFSMGGKNSNSIFQFNCDKLYQEYTESHSTQTKQGSQQLERLYKLSNGTHAIAYPIELYNKVVAVIILYQFIYEQETPSPDFIRNLAESWNIDNSLLSLALKEISVFSLTKIEAIIQFTSILSEMISTLGRKSLEYQHQIRKQSNNDLVMNALLDKISEQEQIIKSLLSNISLHKTDVRENTIDKTAFQRQQKQLVERIRYSEALLNSLLTSVPLGIGFIRHDVFTYTNDQMFRLTGYTPKELIGCDPEFLFASHEEYLKIIEGSPEHFLFKDKNSSETSLVTKDGNIIDVIVFVSQIEPEERAHGIAISIIDISAIKKVQFELIKEKERAEESDRLKSAFLDNMSHELRTPMNAILGFAELLMAPGLTERHRNEYCQIIQDNGKKLVRLMDDIMDISKLSSHQLQLHPKKFSLDQIMLGLYDIFSKYIQKKHGNTVKLILNKPVDKTDDLLFNDDFRIKQVISNLLSNSLKFTAQGSIEFGYNISNETVTFFVKDTGRGIKKSQMEHLFHRFNQSDDLLTREHGGAGLGLSLAKGLVELMGGKIWLETKWRKGTTFYFTVPVKPDYRPEENQEHFQDRKINDWSDKTILIAEDEELNYKYLQMLLQPTKAKIRWVDNGQKAIDFVGQYPNINLILMDIRMPVVNGLEATKTIKSTNHNIPIIAQTAYAQSNEKDRYIKAGCDDFIPKPINSGHFISVLEKFLNTN